MSEKEKAKEVARTLLKKLGPAPRLREVANGNGAQNGKQDKSKRKKNA
ncbi:MAG: hypothetical protein Q9O62_06090 [Ardenticatenia bacterium]|nr:hypothetical protein [Ardenticatenia bacterium]